ncbi:T9SS type A sorting domain-containing protein [Flavobacterium sp.]|uniref:T9SS type A sorting domain-containing protein n=1 Tax=Flavobacterium sp. TaxID=239 RepID=UPI0039E382C4
MSKKLFTFLLLGAAAFSFGQQCGYGTASDSRGIGENMSTGGDAEYSGAGDFDVPFGFTFTASQVTFNVLKGPANLQYVNLAFREEQNGLPGNIIQSFDGLVPASQTLAYEINDDPNLDGYLITIDLPSEMVFQKGRYFLQLSAAAGDEYSAWWEITDDEQTAGVFDYSLFEDEDWGGTGYYNKVFQVKGNCALSGEEQPDLGDFCQQVTPSNGFTTAAPFIANGSIVSVADDFTVAPNTTFYLTHFTMQSLLLGGGLHNATIKIRSAVNGAPGPVLHTFENKGPETEDYDGYWPFPGSPFDVVSVLITWKFEPIEFTEGNYFIEVIPTPYATEFLTWEATPSGTIGDFAASSYDQGETWVTHEGYHLVFAVEGFCSENLGTENPEVPSALKYYPNPVQDVLHISSEKQINGATVYNMEGRQVSATVNNGTVDMQALASGIYMVKVAFGNDTFETFKVVKQ